MRTRTFVFSFLVHSVVLGVAMVVRLVATTELPDPPIATRFMMAAAAEVPEVPPPPQRAPQTAASPVNQNAIPLVAPESIAPEVPRDIPDTVRSGSEFGIGTPGDPVGDLGIGPPPPPRVVQPPSPLQTLRVGGVVRPPQKVHHVAPIYPAIAQAARISGTVILEALIAEDGSVRDVKVLSSKPLLDASALDAVRQWRFTPTLLNGVPVQVIMSVTVTFALN
jgi:periplasmic protein TonB